MRNSWLIQSNVLDKSVITAAKTLLLSISDLIFFNHMKEAVLRAVFFPKSALVFPENSVKIVINLTVEGPFINF